MRKGGGCQPRAVRTPPPLKPVRKGGASGPAQAPTPQNEFNTAEEDAAARRWLAEGLASAGQLVENIEDVILGGQLQAVLSDGMQEEQPASQAEQAPVQPTTSEPAGGSLWTDANRASAPGTCLYLGWL